MITPESLVARFSDPAGFKKNFGILLGKRAKAAHAFYVNAEQRGAARTYALDRRTHDDMYYVIKAISTRGDVDEATLAGLVREASQVPLGTIRYEGAGNAPVLPDAIGSNPDAADVHALSRPEAGIFVYPVTLFRKSHESSWALWALRDGKGYVFPLIDSEL